MSPSKNIRSGNRKASSFGPILEVLARTYPDAICELNHRNPLELLIATMLSAQCTDVLVNQVTPGLFEKYRKASDFAKAPLVEMEQAIRRIGLFRSKAKNILATCQILETNYAGEVPRTMEELTALPGVGRKTANVVLGNAFGIAEGIVVDTHVGRLSQRLGLTREKTAEKIEKDLVQKIPRDQWTILSHRLIWHGRRRCKARNPDCDGCEMGKLCPRRGV